jgi:hypothetical protein
MKRPEMLEGKCTFCVHCGYIGKLFQSKNLIISICKFYAEPNLVTPLDNKNCIGYRWNGATEGLK